MSRLGDKNSNWKGGRMIADGYVYLKMTGHPLAIKNGYVAEHRLVGSLKVGRWLTSHDHVHHLNGIKDDNRPENIEVLSSSDHQRQHSCGTKNARFRHDIHDDTILALFRTGNSVASIARQMGVGETSIFRRLDTMIKRQKKIKKHDLDLSYLKTLKEQGLSYEKIAAIVGVTTMTVFRRIRGDVK